MAVGLILPSSAAALSQGTISGVVTGSNGPVAGARVVMFGANNNLASATTNGTGSFQVEAWPDTYRIGAYPPSGSANAFSSIGGVVVSEGATSTANINLTASAGSTGQVSGNASYSDHAADAGVEVLMIEERLGVGEVLHTARAFTDEAGNWSGAALSPGFYRVSYSVATSTSNLQPENHYLGSELITVEAGSNQVLAKELSGPRPQASLSGTVVTAEGWLSATHDVHVAQVGGGVSGDLAMNEGKFRISALPTGTYEVSATGDQNEDDSSGVATVSVSDGHASSTSVQLAANPVPAGAAAAHEQQELAWFNAQRARWGLPAGLVSVPLWSQACAAHDAYGELNKVLNHPEQAGAPGHSVGGQWAGEHAALAEGTWGPETNPWMDAPYHLEQIMAPRLSKVGLDQSVHDYQCLTTWPGMLRPKDKPGTIYTFPGDGTTGFPPLEFAAELPSTPNEALHLPALTGRQLLVYEEGPNNFPFNEMVVKSASLTSAAGPVEVKWVQGPVAAIIVPVTALKPFTIYTASVTLGPQFNYESGLEKTVTPQLTHTWSFTTGRENPGGNWSEPKAEREKPRGPQRKISAKWSKGQIIVKGWNFKKGKVVIKRKVLLKSKRRFNGKIMARAHVGAKGTFLARFHWPKRHISLRVYQDGKSTFGIYNPPHPPSWYRHHHKHG